MSLELEEDDDDDGMCAHAEQAQNLTTVLIALAIKQGGRILLTPEDIKAARGTRFCIHMDPVTQAVQIHAETTAVLPAQTHEAPTTRQ